MFGKKKAWWKEHQEPMDWEDDAADDVHKVVATTRYAILHSNGSVFIRSRRLGDRNALVARAYNLRNLIASLEALLAVAEEHFGEDWGKA